MNRELMRHWRHVIPWGALGLSIICLGKSLLALRPIIEVTSSDDGLFGWQHLSLPADELLLLPPTWRNLKVLPLGNREAQTKGNGTGGDSFGKESEAGAHVPLVIANKLSKARQIKVLGEIDQGGDTLFCFLEMATGRWFVLRAGDEEPGSPLRVVRLAPERQPVLYDTQSGQKFDLKPDGELIREVWLPAL